MKALTLTCFGLFFAGVGAFILQMWFEPWSASVFMKIILTDIGLFAIIFVLAFLIKENKESKKISDDELK